MNDLFLGQLLAIFILGVGMSYILGGKGIASKVARLPLRALKAVFRPLWKRTKRALGKAWNWAWAQLWAAAMWLARGLWRGMRRGASALWARLRGTP